MKQYRNKKIQCFVIGLFSYITIRVIGVVSVSELIALIFMILYFKKSDLMKNIYIRRMFMFLFLWITGSIIADIYNDNTNINLIKGVGTIAFFYPSIFIAYWMLKDNYHYIIYYLAGRAISSLLTLVLPNATMYDYNDALNIWLVYIIAPVIVFFVSYFYFKNKNILAIIMIFLFAFWAIFNNSRNIFLIWLIVGCLLLFLLPFGLRYGKTRKFSSRQTIMFFLFAITAVFIANTVYTYLAENGKLSESAENKYRNQKNDKLGFLSGRIDFVHCIFGIMENPVVGYGSYAEDKTNIRIRASLKYQNAKYDPSELNMVPRHSYFLGAWIFSGILSVPFWLYTLFLILIFLRKYLLYDKKMLATMLLFIFSLLWNIFFSPLQQRIDFSVIMVCMILIITLSQKETNALSPFNKVR